MLLCYELAHEGAHVFWRTPAPFVEAEVARVLLVRQNGPPVALDKVAEEKALGSQGHGTAGLRNVRHRHGDLAADGAAGHAADEVALEEDVDEKYGAADDEAAGSQEGHVGGVLTLEEGQANGQRAEALARDEDQGQQELVPGPHEEQHDEGEDGRTGDRDQDAPEDAEAVAAVDERGVDQLPGDVRKKPAIQKVPKETLSPTWGKISAQ